MLMALIPDVLELVITIVVKRMPNLTGIHYCNILNRLLAV